MKRIAVGLMCALMVATLLSMYAVAGQRAPIIRYANQTTTSTTTAALSNAEFWDCRAVLNNFSGTLALDVSYDEGATWVNLTTTTGPTSSFNIRSATGEVATNIRAVITDTFTDYTGTETRFQHINPGVDVHINQYYERD